MNKRIGIMQGRLSLPTEGKFQSFPKYTWKEEFYKAKNCGLKSIEWIFEADEYEKNPLSSDEGIQQIKELSKITDVSIESVCADYFMDIPYLVSSPEIRIELQNKLIWLVKQVSNLGIKYIDLPFVDASSIGNTENFKYVIEFVKPALLVAEQNNVIIALETDLNPKYFRLLLDQFNHPYLKANYDTGNSSGIGYDCTEELNSYGNYINTVHIKDRLIDNGTMPLGTGSADFDAFFSSLYNLNYTGPIILQAAREEDEEKTAVKNLAFVESYLKKYNI
jgi:L-ribulose-5-phosphate 3-epimerase